MSLFDSSDKYGLVSRALHWLMALGFVWMFFTAALHYFADETPITDALWPTHPVMGFTVFCLAILRVVWAVVNMSRRPPSLSLLSGLGHSVLYALMLVIPALALLRNYGADRPFSYLGISLMAPTGQKTQWMIDLAGLLHGELGWTMLALVLGHIGMVVVHKKSSSTTDVLPRML
ncbi:cytochrome b [Advenella mimigardefordensis]|uniref:Putative cytochrome b561 n=1 Tax=Advenella mimigardefordensis (strain DSM 17166 / LMG 22922 / DPN7) TaxID=1247726 RepID=W0P9V8_ADVMD|nr:cytochrome b [Advenella mimigardefordensis]AHG62267.1 putative cytochrome b561 [Advenella mimigardefordensis DPN7]